jgi:hypothetical protein
MIVSIHQPNFLPWPGYFHKMAKADRFVLLDDVQYVKGTVANRAYICRKDGTAVYITVPVSMSKGAFQAYNEIAPDPSAPWQSKMLNQVKDAYLKTAFFQDIFPTFSEILLKKYDSLADLNIAMITFVAAYLGIHTPTIRASSLQADLGKKSDRNLNICKHLGAGTYLSGTGARAYNDEESFRLNGLNLLYTNYILEDRYKSPDEQGNLVHLSILHFMMLYSPETIKGLILQPSS